MLNRELDTKDVDYIIAIDTDSVYINMDAYVEKYAKGLSSEEIVDFLDGDAKDRFEPYILKSYEKMAKYFHAYKQNMFNHV